MIIHGDCIEEMQKMDACSIDAIITDPPYGLAFMGKEWDGYTSPIAFQEWCESWAREALRVLKPGGHILAFGGTRMYHRLVSGIEDAGFEIRDCLMWIYGSGFPKSLDVSKAIDKAAGAEREVIIGAGRSNIGTGKHGRGVSIYSQVVVDATNEKTVRNNISIPSTEAAKKWQGWGTSLKPAVEPIVLARKPLIGTVAKNVLEYGTGALNIDASRIGIVQGDEPKAGKRTATFGTLETTSGGDGSGGWKASSGRWPANILLDEEAAAILDEQSGELTSGTSRFFYVAKASRSERNAGPERNIHPTVKPVKLMRYLVRLITPNGGVVLDPFLGSGTTGVAAIQEGKSWFGIEREIEYVEIARGRTSAAVVQLDLDLG
jgi:site-specific DNA-methyltransferase (adenine-specific)